MAEGNADFTSNNASLRPINGGSINGKNAARFLAGDLFNMEVIPQSAGQIFVLGKRYTNNGVHTIVGTQSGTNARVRWEMLTGTSGIRVQLGTTMHTFAFTNLPENDAPFVAMLQWDGTNVTVRLITASGDQTLSQTQNGSPLSTIRFFVGAVNASGSPSIYFNGEFNHVVYYHTSLWEGRT